MSDGAVVVDGIGINLPTLGAAVDAAAARAEAGRGFALFTLNLDHLVKLRTDPAFRAAYERAELVSADGWPVVWLAGRGAGNGRLERTTGADLVEPLMAEAAARGLGVYVVGPGLQAQAKALKALRRLLPALRIAGTETPRVPADPLDGGFDLDALARRIEASGARLCLLCLGAPKQELLADALKARCPAVGFLCVGAALDFIAGEASRAPGWAQKAGLEWFWRLTGDPKRLALRYARCAVRFAELAAAPPRAQPRA